MTRILIAEDEGIIAKDMRNRLTMLEYTVIAAVPSGEEAVKKTEEINPDLILMDITLKGAMSGIEAAEKIRTFSNIPIIYLTAHSDETIFQQAKTTEPYGYILKPFNEREMHLTIEMAVYRYKMEEALRLSAKVFENAMDKIMITDTNGTILKVNDAFTEITGYSPEDVIGKTPGILKSGRHDAEFYKNIWKALTETGKWEGEIWNRKKDGRVYPEWAVIVAVKNIQGRATHYISMARDITERSRYEEKIKYQAYHDTLTGLPNRLLFYDRLSIALSNTQRSKRMLSVMFLDLDGFKTINDTFGHDTGDSLLQSVTKKLINCTRQGDTVARMGGDEFTLILPQIVRKDEAEIIARRILSTLQEPFLINEHNLSITVSIGISFYPDDGDDVQTLMKKADGAMYSAKEKGKNNYRFYAEIGGN